MTTSTPASHPLADTSIDDSAPLARTAHRKACADAVSRHRAGWVARRIPSGGSLCRTRVFCTAYMRSIEGSASPQPEPPTTPSPATPSSEPTIRLHATGADRRTSLTYAWPLCMSRVAVECHEMAQVGAPLCEDITKGRGGNNRTPSRIELAGPFRFANRDRQQRQRSAKKTNHPYQHRSDRIGAGCVGWLQESSCLFQPMHRKLRASFLTFFAVTSPSRSKSLTDLSRAAPARPVPHAGFLDKGPSS